MESDSGGHTVGSSEFLVILLCIRWCDAPDGNLCNCLLLSKMTDGSLCNAVENSKRGMKRLRGRSFSPANYG
eukprot:8031129-Ditylum_brightwellii.AAC.1